MGACCSVDGGAVGAVEADEAGTGVAVAGTGVAVAVGGDGFARDLRRVTTVGRVVDVAEISGPKE